jgi:hypothetical protein
MEESKVNSNVFYKENSVKLIKNKTVTNFYLYRGAFKKEDNQKNNDDIKSLTALIKKNNLECNSKISKIQKEIIELKEKKNNIKVPNCKYTKRDIEQNLIKQKLLSNTINLYKEEFDSNKENLLLLEEEYNNSELQLLNLISLKDNYEEIIKENSKYIFQNLMISYDQNMGQSISANSFEDTSHIFLFNNNTNLKIEAYDINNIQNLPKFSNMIYKILSSHVASLLTEKNIKALIFSSIEEIYYNFIDNKITADDFVKKIAFNISTSDVNIHNFIVKSRFELLLKYIIKTLSLEKIINNIMSFLNKEYSYNKKILEKNEEKIKQKIQQLTKDKIEQNKNYIIIEKEYNIKVDSLNKIEKINLEIKRKEEEIKNEGKKYKLLEINQKRKINKLNKISKKNSDIYLKESDIQKTIQNIQKNINNLSYNIRKNQKEKTQKSNSNLNSADLCNITDINNKKLNQFNINRINTDCYILIENNINNIKLLDPIKDYDIKPESKGYNKSSIIYQDETINIIFNQIKENINIKIDKYSIKNIIINPIIKKIVYYMKKYNKEKNKLELILSDKNLEINKDELIKYIYNKYFCLTLLLTNDKVINIIFLTYENFKIWLKIFDSFNNNI